MIPSSSPRVLHISTEPEFRGGERQLLWLHRGLLERGIKSHVICREGSELSRMEIPNRLVSPWNGSHDVGGFFHMLGHAVRIRPHVVHCHDSHAHNVGAFFRNFLPARLVLTRRVLFPVKQTWFNRWRFGRCQRIIAISTAVAEECLRIAPNVAIDVVPDGVRWNSGKSAADALAASLDLAPDHFVLGAVGHFSGDKNVEQVLSVAESLRRDCPRARVVLVGPVQEDARARAEALPNVVVTGRVARATDYYPLFHGYLATSRREGLGSAVLDAVVRDIPVVAVDSGGVRDLFPDPENLIREEDGAAYYDAVRALIRDPEPARVRAREIGERARRRFSVQQMVEGTMGVYRDALR